VAKNNLTVQIKKQTNSEFHCNSSSQQHCLSFFTSPFHFSSFEWIIWPRFIVTLVRHRRYGDGWWQGGTVRFQSQHGEWTCLNFQWTGRHGEVSINGLNLNHWFLFFPRVINLKREPKTGGYKHWSRSELIFYGPDLFQFYEGYFYYKYRLCIRCKPWDIGGWNYRLCIRCKPWDIGDETRV
jgi:hypothetical protein